jgi:hypothetical protein
LAPYLFRKRGTASDEAYLLGVLSSIPFDWFARRYVELHLNVGLLSAFPVPRPDSARPLQKRAVEIAGILAAIDSRYATWATEVGVPVGSVTDAATRNDLVAELDAVVALLYGLERAQVEHVFATFHRGWDYQPRLAAAMSHYERWAQEEGMTGDLVE